MSKSRLKLLANIYQISADVIYSIFIRGIGVTLRLILIYIMTRLVDQNVYGEYVYFFSIFMTLGLLSRLGFDLLIQVSNRIEEVFANTIIVSSIIVVLLGVGVSLFEEKMVARIIIATILYNYFHLTIYGLRSQGKTVASFILQDVVWPGLFILVILIQSQIWEADLLNGLLLNSVICFGISLVILPVKFSYDDFTSTQIRNVYSRSNFGFIIFALMSVMIAWGDQLVLKHYANTEVLATYFVLLKFGNLMLIPSAVMAAKNLKILNNLNYNNRFRFFTKTVGSLALINSFIATILLIIFKEIIAKLYPILSEYTIEFRLIVLTYIIIGSITYFDTYCVASRYWRSIISTKTIVFLLICAPYIFGYVFDVRSAAIVLVSAHVVGYVVGFLLHRMKKLE